MDNDKEVTLAEYFKISYDKVITNNKQPLFEVKQGGNIVYLPPEFCFIDGVPESIRRDSLQMNLVLKTCRKNANEKVTSIQQISNKLSKTQTLCNWGVKVGNKAFEMEAEILPAPTLVIGHGQQTTYTNDCLRKLPIQKSKDLTYERWIVLYSRNNYEQADKIYGLLTKACGQLRMKVEEPYWIELDSEENLDLVHK